MNNLINKNSFITGATGGLGKSFVQTLAKQGSNLFLTATERKEAPPPTKKEKKCWTQTKTTSKFDLYMHYLRSFQSINYRAFFFFLPPPKK